ncbi:FAD-binding oxidoreductase [Bradyrhizobium sp. NAS96.2]|uniref:FAD-binding oxidoreductase n=1 Tax=Bradyrhizobium sp. NAS96.2 TaxID=1680160 RepID=UPI00093B7A77|nr:FAD-binding oxidoreductase [Bradyrhizobium sp. NAS96.2]OKO83137.1 FAD-linked oxidase [Bradyrhizobium sp. NAS96.2]
MTGTRLKHYGWGREGEGMSAEERAFVLGRYHAKFAAREFDTVTVPGLEELSLREPRVVPPASLTPFCTTERYDRAAHTYGKSYPDYVRAMLGDYDSAPDVVAYPRNESEISAVMDWAGSVGASLTPFGGGSSVCGGVEPQADGTKHKAAVTLDLRNLSKVVEVDPLSRAALIDAGTYGPSLENQLKPHGITLRHFPQSFEYSTLGGWIATRSGGHFASLYTHIDDFVESLRVVTPVGVVETRRLPGSGAGPSPDRMFIGSEGILGVISRAWMRLQPRPKFRAGASVRFPTFFDAARAVRAVAQAGLYPSNCRILDPQEAFNTGAADGNSAIMVLAFESGDHPLDAWFKRALECCADHRGTPEPAEAGDAHLEGAAGIWRNAFIRMPYAREFLTPAAIINDTFETAITWDRFESFHDQVKAGTERAILQATGVKGEVTCRFTHVYPDGPAPYFSFHARGRHGALLAQWQAIKDAASDALIAAGGTITHHHAVGRDHRPWYDRQRPQLFAAALRAAKRELDPRGMLNPGVLIDP